MPRYFFDTTNGERFLADETGHELDNDDDARFEALDALPDMAREEMPAGDRRVFKSFVRDETGEVIYEAELLLIGRWKIGAPLPAELFNDNQRARG